MPFYQNQTILDVILARLKNGFPDIPIILATTTNQVDEKIENTGKNNKVTVFRGDEENVLRRFISAAKENSVDHIIRICADNPFISTRYLNDLIAFYKTKQVDYVSYMSKNNLPAMKTHYGFFAEIMTYNALLRTSEGTTDKLYLEHVTNYIYGNADKFSLCFLAIPPEIENADIRLTVDTIEDFNNCKQIYESLKSNNVSIEPDDIISYIKNNRGIIDIMKNQINLNRK